MHMTVFTHLNKCPNQSDYYTSYFISVWLHGSDIHGFLTIFNRAKVYLFCQSLSKALTKEVEKVGLNVHRRETNMPVLVSNDTET